MKARTACGIVMLALTGMLAVAEVASAATRYPAGGVVLTSRQPTFSWPSVSGATWYQIWINKGGQTYHHLWVNGVTSWKPTWNLPAGQYRWWYQAWSPTRRYATWSSPSDFSIQGQVPGTLTLISPSGQVSGSTQTFRWVKDSRATWYQIYVQWNDRKVFDQWIEASGTGELTKQASGFTSGNYVWWVRGWSPDGYGPWSAGKSFTISQPALPAKPSLMSPTGEIADTRPLFKWNASANTEWYRLYVQRGATGVVDKWTQSTTLTSPATLSGGQHTWWVGAWNSNHPQQTVWSNGLQFTVTSTSLVSQHEARAHSLVNSYRTANGRAALSYDSRIAAIARVHSQNAANGVITKDEFIAHKGFKDVANSRSYQVGQIMTVSSVKENVQWNQGYADPPMVAFESWRTSTKGHNETMLDGALNVTGVGAAQAANGAWFFTQIFAKSP